MFSLQSRGFVLFSHKQSCTGQKEKYVICHSVAGICLEGLAHDDAVDNDPYQPGTVIKSHNCRLWIHKLNYSLLERFRDFSAVLGFQFCFQSLRLLLKYQQRSTPASASCPPPPEPKHQSGRQIEAGRGLSTAPIGKKTRHWHNRAAFTRDGTANEGGGEKFGKKGWSRIWDFFFFFFF